jgi:hypothetical protein
MYANAIEWWMQLYASAVESNRSDCPDNCIGSSTTRFTTISVLLESFPTHRHTIQKRLISQSPSTILGIT